MLRSAALPAAGWCGVPVCLRPLGAQWPGPASRAPGGRKLELGKLLRWAAQMGLQFNEHIAEEPGDIVFQHACKMGLEGIVSKRLGSRYRSGRTGDWLKLKNPAAPAVRREAEEDWGRRWRR